MISRKHLKKVRILTIILFFSSVFQLMNAQETIKQLGLGDFPSASDIGDVYYKDVNNYFTKFLGKWLYNDEIIYFKVTFIKKVRVRMGNTNTYYDELVCEFLLKINGEEIYNTYGTNSNISNSSLSNYITGSGIYNSIPNRIDLFYSEPPLNGSCQRYAYGDLMLQYVVNMNIEQIIWTRTNKELYGDSIDCPNGTRMDTSVFLIPENMILIKQ